MDKIMIEKRIAAVTEQIRKDEAEAERTAAQIRRAQDRKHFLESRLKENRQSLSDLKNRKAMLAIEGSVGQMDDAKLALVVKLLKEHGGDIAREEADERPETGAETKQEGV